MKQATPARSERGQGNASVRRFAWFLVVVMLVMVCLLAGRAMAARARTAVAHDLVGAANAWLDSLDAVQRGLTSRPFDDAKRTDWHFIPKPMRKGVQLRDMTEPQQAAALALLRSLLSQVGYDKSVAIMELDEILRVLEGSRAKNIRDPKRYFFTIFGTPSDDGPWAISFEGHHLSLNFTVRDGRIVDSTPQFMGANPAVVKKQLPNLPVAGHRVLEAEESVAFELVNSLDDGQRAKAVISPEPPKEIRGAGEPQPSGEPAVVIAWGGSSTCIASRCWRKSWRNGCRCSKRRTAAGPQSNSPGQAVSNRASDTITASRGRPSSSNCATFSPMLKGIRPTTSTACGGTAPAILICP